MNLKRAAVSLCATMAALVAALALIPDKYAQEASEQRTKADLYAKTPMIEYGVTSRIVTFHSIRGEKASLIIGCGDDDLSFEFYQTPTSPPPLRGVYINTKIGTDPAVRLEVGYLMGGFWTVRETDALGASKILSKFKNGADFSATLPPPYGTGRATSWQTKLPFDYCDAKSSNAKPEKSARQAP